MPRKAHKYHYIYKTTCNVTGKYYIGMHSTSNLEDGYMGSGKRLRRSLIKHGIENHTKEILEFLEDRVSLAKREKEIVDKTLLDESLCMNLKEGGEGGGGFWNKEHQLKCSLAGAKNGAKISNEIQKTLRENPEWVKQKSERISSACKGLQNFKGRTHKEETKALIREKAKERIGDKNSQYGTCWITNGIQNMKIHKGDSIPEGWSLGRKNKTAISLES
jgi:gas vesicle protein